MNKRAVIVAICAISILFAIQNSALTFADNSTDISVTTGEVLQLEVPNSASLLLNPASSAGDFKTTTITATVSTNNMLGYTLTVSPSNAAETTDLIGSIINMQTLESSIDGYTESTFTANKWGYRLSGNSNYFGIPSTLAPEAWDTSGPTNETEHNLTLAAKVDGSFPAGTYTTTLNFELVAKRDGLDWENVVSNCTTHPEKCDSVTGKVAIQSIDEEVCNAVEIYDSQYQVTDLRDHKNYWISKLKDGNCWMTQNLDLDITSGVALTNTLTDIGWNGSGYDTASWTPNKTTYRLATSEGDQWQQSGPPGSDAFSMDPGDWYEKSDYEPPTSAEACNYPFDSANCTNVISNAVDDTKGTHGHIGNYYTWSAAVASNNTYTSSGNIGVTTDSICPTNWRLPAVGDDNNDFSNINRLYNDDSSVTDSKLTQAPVYSTRNGYVLSTPVYFGTLETYWSNEDANSGVAYLFFANPGGVQTKYASFHKTAGFVVRCVGRKANYVTISFNANGGTGSMPPQRIKQRASDHLLSNTFTRDGYYFKGWNTLPYGNGTDYKDGDSITPYSDTTLYAQWSSTPPICTANCDSDNPTYEFDITLQRAYEIAYNNAHKGMYEEITPGSGTYQWIDSWSIDDSWDNDEYQGQGRDVRFLIQDMTPEICDMTTVINSTAHVLDIRDQTSYYVVKAADGRCWMKDNLALDLTAVGASANITAANTNASAASLASLFASISTWTSGYSYSAPMIYTVLKDDTYSSDWYAPNSKYGIFYNYCAASAGSYCYGNGTSSGTSLDRPGTAIDAEYDICPSGWRLPTSSTYDATNLSDGGEIHAIYAAYGSKYTDLRYYLGLPLSGAFRFDIGTKESQEGTGNFWSSTRYDGRLSNYYPELNSNNSMDYFSVNFGGNYYDDVAPEGVANRYYGLSVRCINKPSN